LRSVEVSWNRCQIRKKICRCAYEGMVNQLSLFLDYVSFTK
jgi:hypothetical protein